MGHFYSRCHQIYEHLEETEAKTSKLLSTMEEIDDNDNHIEAEDKNQEKSSNASKTSKLINFFAKKFHTEKEPFHHVNSMRVHQNNYRPRRKSAGDKLISVNSMIVHQNNYSPKGKHAKKRTISGRNKEFEVSRLFPNKFGPFCGWAPRKFLKSTSSRTLLIQI